jgi:hypothetical protein
VHVVKEREGESHYFVCVSIGICMALRPTHA